MNGSSAQPGGIPARDSILSLDSPHVLLPSKHHHMLADDHSSIDMSTNNQTSYTNQHVQQQQLQQPQQQQQQPHSSPRFHPPTPRVQPRQSVNQLDGTMNDIQSVYTSYNNVHAPFITQNSTSHQNFQHPIPHSVPPAYDDQNTLFLNQITQLNNEKFDLQNQIENLERDLCNLQFKLEEENLDQKKLIHKYQSSQADYINDRKSFKHQIQQLEKDVAEKASENQQLEKDAAEKASKMQQLDTTVVALRVSMENCQSQLDRYKTAFSNVVKEREALEVEKAALETKLFQYDKQLAETQKNLGQECDRYKAENELLKKQQKSVGADLSRNIQESFNKVEKEQKQLQNDQKRLQIDKLAFNKEKTDLNKAVRDLIQQLDKEQANNQALQKQLETEQSKNVQQVRDKQKLQESFQANVKLEAGRECAILLNEKCAAENKLKEAQDRIRELEEQSKIQGKQPM